MEKLPKMKSACWAKKGQFVRAVTCGEACNWGLNKGHILQAAPGHIQASALCGHGVQLFVVADMLYCGYGALVFVVADRFYCGYGTLVFVVVDMFSCGHGALLSVVGLQICSIVGMAHFHLWCSYFLLWAWFTSICGAVIFFCGHGALLFVVQLCSIVAMVHYTICGCRY